MESERGITSYLWSEVIVVSQGAAKKGRIKWTRRVSREKLSSNLQKQIPGE